MYSILPPDIVSKISKWKLSHEQVCHSELFGPVEGKYSYIFTPTQAGLKMIIKCNYCNESTDLKGTSQ